MQRVQNAVQFFLQLLTVLLRPYFCHRKPLHYPSISIQELQDSHEWVQTAYNHACLLVICLVLHLLEYVEQRFSLPVHYVRDETF